MNHPEGPSELSVGVITVGDEILEGRILDSHSRFISEELLRWGGQVRWHLSLGDSPGELQKALSLWQGEVDWIVITGGLGPTEDDRTRQEVAEFIGVELVEDFDSWTEIRQRLRSRGFEPTDNNRKQAFFPRGSEVLSNPKGSAPGFSVALHS
ncbi:hypothetical protein CBD41_00335, partial [bacterium TMED181]